MVLGMMSKNKKNTTNSFMTRSALIVVGAIIVATVPMGIINARNFAYADQYDSQINALQKQIDGYNSQISNLSGQADTLQNKINSLNTQISSLQTQINLSQAKYDQLVAKIAETQKEIDDNKDALGKIIADMYVDDKVTPIEMIASSSTIGEYLDKQEYRSSVRTQLTSKITSIKDLKTQLEKDKASAEDVLNTQKAQQNNLGATKSEQQSLLSETQNQESSYQSLVAAAKSKIEAAAAAQQAYFASLGSGAYSAQSVTTSAGVFGYNNWSGNKGCGGGYPYCGSQDSSVDPWGLYNRECVSWAAWRISNGYGKYVGNFSGHGMAYEWPYSAQSYSGAYPVSNPQPGDAVVLPATAGFAPVGHLMVVESVGSGAYPIHVSQYNFGGTGQYSTMDIKASGVIFLRFR